jgi:pyridoxine 4-dehydrogenase
MSDIITADQAGTITLGDITVNRIGLGTNRVRDTASGHALLQRAVELEINFIDTAHVYAEGQSEVAIGNALSPYKPGVIIATKCGMGNGAAPDQLRLELNESLRRLKTDCIDIYQLHRIDPETPLTKTMQALKQFQDEGLIRHIGLSEVDVDQLEQALSVAPVVSVQNEYNIANRKHESLLEYCDTHSIAFIPWFPLGGLAGDTVKVEALVGDIAKKYGVTAQQVALAWLLRRSKVILPIPGSLSVDHLEDNLRAASLELSDLDFQTLSNS